MRLQVEVELDGMHDVPVDDSASLAVTTPVSLVWPRREEADVVSLADDDDSDSGLDVQARAGSY